MTLERRHDGVALVRLDRPKANALSAERARTSCRVRRGADRRPPGAVVVWGGERIFAAGADIAELEPAGPRRSAANFHAALGALAALPRATIAAVNGYALGGGLELALACRWSPRASGAVVGFGAMTAATRSPLLRRASGRLPQWLSTRDRPRGAPLAVPSVSDLAEDPAAMSAHLPAAGEDPLWFQRAVFYEVFIRGFFDGNNDGVGDLPGLIAKLDYLQWLGIDCLWLLPFYPSPLRDGGYDISDYYSVHPECGTVDDLRTLLDEAHARGIRVIADLVINHTSDQHPWFVESRSSRDNPKADWYVWNDDDQRWPEARVVFIDVERSNWSYDAVRDQYYWHRFYSHQPDLNYDNPEVADAMLDVVRFWLDLGLRRLPARRACPTSSSATGPPARTSPRPTHFIQRIRAELDADYPGRILLAEANGWPADVADYFGDGDECHLCFNFPLMPRLFMAVRREQSYPITEILAQTPEAPPGVPVGDLPAQPRRADPREGQRRGARLPLRRVRQGPADEAAHGDRPPPRPAARPRPPARRAPLLPPASPCRAARSSTTATRSRWATTSTSATATRCARRCSGPPTATAASRRADFAQLYLPPLMDPVYGFAAVNVEAQQRNPSSFLHWMRRHAGRAPGHFRSSASAPWRYSTCPNPSVLAFVRSGEVADVRVTEPVRGADRRRALRWGPGGPTPGRCRPATRSRPGGPPVPGGALRAQPEPVRPAGRAAARRGGPARTPVEVLGRVPVPGHRRGAVHRQPRPLRVPVVRARRTADRVRDGGAR